MKNHARHLHIAGLLVLTMFVSSLAGVVSEKSVGKQKLLVLMIRFQDIVPAFSPQIMKEKYFDKLDRYLQAISYKKTWIEGRMTDWYTLPHEVDHYRLSRHNLEVENERVYALIRDAVDLADGDEDYAEYDMVFISLGAKLEDYGMMGLCGYPGMLGWQSRLPIKTKNRKQEIPEGVAIYCENAHVGVVFHDMAHILGGVKEGRRVLPCLYDHDLQASKGSFRNHYQFYLINVGFFDPMSCHYVDLKQGPPGVCAWTKLRLNWIDTRKIVEVEKGKNKTIVLGPLSSGQSRVLAVKIPIDRWTYYLVENRQPIGPDRILPSHGVLVYYCDDRIAECRHGKSPVKLIDANPSVPQLKDASFTITGKPLFEDKKRNVSIKLMEQNGQNINIIVVNDD